MSAAALIGYSCRALAPEGGGVDGAARPALNGDIEQCNRAAGITAGVGAVLTAAGLIWWRSLRERR
jgi:hypothetical protein